MRTLLFVSTLVLTLTGCYPTYVSVPQQAYAIAPQQSGTCQYPHQPHYQTFYVYNQWGQFVPTAQYVCY